MRLLALIRLRPAASSAISPCVVFTATDAAKLFFGALLTGIAFSLGAIAITLLLTRSAPIDTATEPRWTEGDGLHVLREEATPRGAV